MDLSLLITYRFIPNGSPESPGGLVKTQTGSLTFSLWFNKAEVGLRILIPNELPDAAAPAAFGRG